MGIQIFAIILYLIVLVYNLHNTYKYLVINKRYKVLTHSLFYTFAISLSIGRIIQHANQFSWLSNHFLKCLNQMNDGFSICIGISQIIVICEIVFAMQLFQTELHSMDANQVATEHKNKNKKVQKLHIIALVIILLILVELFLAFIVNDTQSLIATAEIFFVVQLIIIATMMFYYTRRFIILVDEV